MQSLPAPVGPGIVTAALLEAPATAARANTLPDTRADTKGYRPAGPCAASPLPGAISRYGPTSAGTTYRSQGVEQGFALIEGACHQERKLTPHR
jgi:hypothetical protein